jgi:hemerythrin-like metal-binding protein
MPNRERWDPGWSVGHPVIDAQHQALLAQCNLLADHCEPGDGPANGQAFDQAFEKLKALAREHFDAEATLLAAHGDPDLEDHAVECDEFDYLADEVATTEHFDRLELQRFLSLWCVGHIAGSAHRQRALLAATR